MATQAQSAGSFDIGRVFSRGFQAIGNQVAIFLALSILLAGIPSALMQIWLPTNVDDPFEVLSAYTSGGFLVSFLVSSLLSFVLQAALVRATILDLRGQPVELGPVVWEAFALVLPLIALTILMILGLIVGFILLFVPGVILLTMWLVAVPVLIDERRGVFGSFGRSAELTKGYRWWIFLLLVIFMVVSSLLGGLLTVTTGQNVGSTGIMPLTISVVSSTLYGMVTAAMIAALYVELRLLHDGGADSGLAAIFE